MKNNARPLAVLALLAAAPALAATRVAVVIDDFGLTYKANPPDEDWMKFDEPLTFADMPDSPRTKEAAQETLAAGKELIMHYPFDPFQTLDMNPDAATPGDVAKVTKLLEKMMKEVPGAVGLNNHRSDKATKNRPLMRAFMQVYKPKGLYFIDSKVSAQSVAYAEAKAAGIPAAENFIFLDTAQVHTKPFCEKMLARAIAHARKTGEVLVIGHHYFHGTLDCLKEEMPRYAKEGIEFVKASALVR
jgi:polysaccharide deacetylase 2 family uncharacterized protein YibQ